MAKRPPRRRSSAPPPGWHQAGPLLLPDADQYEVDVERASFRVVVAGFQPKPQQERPR